LQVERPHALAMPAVLERFLVDGARGRERQMNGGTGLA
jgi:hypothetical protein